MRKPVSSSNSVGREAEAEADVERGVAGAEAHLDERERIGDVGAEQQAERLRRVLEQRDVDAEGAGLERRRPGRRRSPPRGPTFWASQPSMSSRNWNSSSMPVISSEAWHSHGFGFSWKLNVGQHLDPAELDLGVGRVDRRHGAVEGRQQLQEGRVGHAERVGELEDALLHDRDLAGEDRA